MLISIGIIAMSKALGVCLPLTWVPCWKNSEWQASTNLEVGFSMQASVVTTSGGEMLWKPGHRGKCLLLYRAKRSAVEVQREPGLIALIIQSCNSFCQHEGGWAVPILAAEHCPCFPRRDICTTVLIKGPWTGLAIKSLWLQFNKR